MRVAVAGAGAIGGFIAAALARSGADVAITARGPHLDAIRRHGLRVRSEIGDFTVQVLAGDDLRELGAFDLILATFKAHQWPGMLVQFEPFAKTATIVLPLQNGLPFWYFRDRSLQSVDPGGAILRTFDYGQIVGGVVHVSGNIPSPGVIEQMGGVLYPIGELDGGETPRIRLISQLFARAGLQAPIQAEIRREIWRKILGNVSLNPVSALTRSSIAPMLRDAPLRALIATLMEETIAVAKAAGCDPQITPENRIAFASRLADVKTSMLQDLEAGRPLELEPISGAVVELAGQFGIAVPAMRAVYALARRLGEASRQ